ncbi:MAG TPA: hypothetical protein VGR02_05180 [Thermoanaerobaculia bacterium]|jgi:hypothetical protein|nr:hypothetical protein [Thermoanaerobaculia bacterium]
MNRTLRVLVGVLILLLMSPPMFGWGCPFECRRGVGEDGRDFAHCVEQLVPPFSGTMSSCEEVKFCWTMPGGGRVCDPADCMGGICMEV